MRGVKYRVFLVIFIILSMGMKRIYTKCVYADTGVSDFAALKAILEQGGMESVSLLADIPLEDEIRVRGCKTIVGKGHMLFRISDHHKNLFAVEDAKLTIQNVCITGKKERQKETVTAFGIGKKGIVEMDGGELTEHYNAAGGPAVRIEPGGRFEIKAGIIQNNKAIATGKRKGRDARGGAIANQGKVLLTGGILSHNEAIGETSGSVNYGGIGGMLYNQGECVIGKAVIKDNQATTSGMDMYHEKEAVCRTIKENGNLSSKVQSVKEAEDGEEERTKVTEREEKTVIRQSKKKKKEDERGKPAKREERRKEKGAGEKNRNKKKTGHITMSGSERYFFLWEVRGFSESDWSQKLRQGEKKLRTDFKLQWNWNGLLANKQGKYMVQVMTKKGKKVKIPVTIVPEAYEKKDRAYLIRFYKPKEKSGEKQTWHFQSKDIKAVKDYLRQQENPLSGEENQNFYREFAGCLK